MSLIHAHKLQKVYADGTRAVADISFDVSPGEFVAIMGPSGSGKSTLLHILGFLDRQSGGEYKFEGKAISDYTDDELARVRNKKMGFVFQMFNLLPRTTVLDNVKLPFLYSDIPEPRRTELAKEAIESVGLGHRMYHDSGKLSGGEKQRVAIARALTNDPAVIFADEPTGNLDSKSGLAVMEILQKLNEEKKHTIILITHETNTAEYAKRLIRVKDGMLERDEMIANRRIGGGGFLK